ncbi:DUF4389 domain-containing protein [Ornithinimicrobium sp. W1665]|uniref:DUF4389 domain-containing protein n=1 Tax=Ornithinimicrobium sp. W1665 TaxID=3416666 RepID=UPI003CF4FC64
MTAVLAAGTVPAYPVHLTAEPRPDRPSRGLWVIKWLLIVPHAIVLAVLWAAFLVLTVVAFFAILFTGRYPRAVFDFNVGVLRWSWRVAYYAYGALGTDRYPPFTLHDVPDYPAHLEVDRPGQLSRGLVLVKWWLLAIPHYLVVAVLTTNGIRWVGDARVDGLAWETAEGARWVWEGGGLIALLAVVAGFFLLFTGRYPQGLYDLLLGLNRWVLRVAGYAALMTDTYPPFRLDQGGGSDPQDTLAPYAPAGTSLHAGSPLLQDDAPQAPSTTGRSSWTTGRVVSVVAGALALLLGLGLVVGGAGVSALRQDGWVTSPTLRVQTDGYAVATEPLELRGLGLDEGLGQLRVRAQDTDGGEVFVGVARADDAAAYLAGVQHTVQTGPLTADAREVEGLAPRTDPYGHDVWVASAEGPDRQSVELPATPGSWVVVVMPADGTAGLEARIDVAATMPWARPLGGALLTLGVLLLLGGGAAVALAVRAAEADTRA